MNTWQPPSPSVALLQTAFGSAQGNDQAILAGKAYAANFTVAGVAAQNTTVGINNPAASGKDVWIDGLVIVLSAAAQVNIGGTNAPFGGSIGAWKNRSPALANANADYRGLNQVGIPHNFSYAIVEYLLGNPLLWIPPTGPFYVPPGKTFAVGVLTVNVGATIAIFGREY
jgi:hypothetical protein